MQNYKQQFKGKKITIMGLGMLGRGLGYTKFLAECGADLIVTDLKTKEQLATSIKALSKYSNPANGASIKFVLGEHRIQDFKNRDMIIKNPGVPMDSIYIKEARENNIQIEMDVSLFAKSAPEVMIIGVTGTRGKSMTTMLIHEILTANKKFLRKEIYLGGNIRGVATLPLLKKVKAGDIVVCELDSWQLQGFGEDKISPHISVFTTFMRDHMNYYKDDMKKYFADKANIFKYQKKGDTLVIRKEMKKLIPKKLESKLIVANEKVVKDWQFIVPGSHQRANLACAVEVAKLFEIPEIKIKKVVKDFGGMEGRLEYMKNVKGVKIYNDNNATTPEATIASLEALKSGSPTSRNIILISGGNDKNIDLKNFVNAINKYCKSVVLIPGTGTDKLVSSKLKVVSSKVDSLKEAVKDAIKESKRGDIILFSPAFSSFSQYNNEYERNDEFVKIIKKLK
ncbi:MAG: UDP-N-acetylmuramoylalanine--D-glutamate ligase [Patescibacteria group bacterium]|nr:UDP-N-acetylmuramoylalanine--D-glutamate ligase [Patescibacteria group bacterium]